MSFSPDLPGKPGTFVDGFGIYSRGWQHLTATVVGTLSSSQRFKGLLVYIRYLPLNEMSSQTRMRLGSSFIDRLLNCLSVRRNVQMARRRSPLDIHRRDPQINQSPSPEKSLNLPPHTPLGPFSLPL